LPRALAGAPALQRLAARLDRQGGVAARLGVTTTTSFGSQAVVSGAPAPLQL